jgi:hypothetical protein
MREPRAKTGRHDSDDKYSTSARKKSPAASCRGEGESVKPSFLIDPSAAVLIIKIKGAGKIPPLWTYEI